MGLIEIGEVMMVTSERHLELVSQNITNASTPGFKKSVTFEEAIGADTSVDAPHIASRPDLSQGPLRETGRPLDLAVSGGGLFMVRSEDGHTFYTRNGQFSRASDGRIVAEQGYALQGADGGDIVVDGDHPEILNDGTVLENGAPVARIVVVAPSDSTRLEALSGTLFSSQVDNMHEVTSPLLRQGMLESANVDNAAEILQMMATMRQAEAGARVVEAYDSLLGQSISTFGRS